MSKQGIPRRPSVQAQTVKASWPQGATAGLLLIAAACLGISLTLYHLAGPRDTFAADEAGPYVH